MEYVDDFAAYAPLVNFEGLFDGPYYTFRLSPIDTFLALYGHRILVSLDRHTDGSPITYEDYLDWLLHQKRPTRQIARIMQQGLAYQTYFQYQPPIPSDPRSVSVRRALMMLDRTRPSRNAAKEIYTRTKLKPMELERLIGFYSYPPPTITLDVAVALGLRDDPVFLEHEKACIVRQRQEIGRGFYK